MPSKDAALREAESRNLQRDLRWSAWWPQPLRPLSADADAWVLIRVRMVAPDEAELPAAEFELAVRTEVDESLRGPVWRVSDGERELLNGSWAEEVLTVHVREVRLTGSCPDTRLEVLYEALQNRGAACGMRWPLWPAGSRHASEHAKRFVTSFMESSPGVHTDKGKSTPDITWFDARGRPLPR